MHRALLCGLCALVGCRSALASPDDGKVHGTVTIHTVQGWCAGMAPPENWKPTVTDQPAQKRLLFRRGKVNSDAKPAAEVTSTGGAFAVALEPGTWCVVDDSKRKVARGDADKKGKDWDQKCLLLVRKQCDTVIEVRADQATPDVDLVYGAGGCSWQPPRCSLRHVNPPP